MLRAAPLLLALLLAVSPMGAVSALACSYASWSPREEARALRAFQAEDLARSNFIFVARVTDRQPSREVLAVNIDYTPIAVVRGGSDLPPPWQAEMTCETPLTQHDVGDLMLVFASTEASASPVRNNLYPLAAIQDRRLRREAEAAVRRAQRD